mmetsp:Transcript_38494/g.100766  ORF Transcript_38494/g.100766 Transcript_38494/m.100766 type:complete len:105 (+) Transcript_38494:2822-3136(+)
MASSCQSVSVQKSRKKTIKFLGCEAYFQSQIRAIAVTNCHCQRRGTTRSDTTIILRWEVYSELEIWSTTTKRTVDGSHGRIPVVWRLRLHATGAFCLRDHRRLQ